MTHLFSDLCTRCLNAPLAESVLAELTTPVRRPRRDGLASSITMLGVQAGSLTQSQFRRQRVENWGRYQRTVGPPLMRMMEPLATTDRCATTGVHRSQVFCHLPACCLRQVAASAIPTWLGGQKVRAIHSSALSSNGKRRVMHMNPKILKLVCRLQQHHTFWKMQWKGSRGDAAGLGNRSSGLAARCKGACWESIGPAPSPPLVPA